MTVVQWQAYVKTTAIGTTVRRVDGEDGDVGIGRSVRIQALPAIGPEGGLAATPRQPRRPERAERPADRLEHPPAQDVGVGVDALGFFLAEVVVDLERRAFREDRPIMRVAGRQEDLTVIQPEPLPRIPTDRSRERRGEAEDVGAHQDGPPALRVLEGERPRPEFGLDAFGLLVPVVGEQIAGLLGRDLHLRRARAVPGPFLRRGQRRRRRGR